MSVEPLRVIEIDYRQILENVLGGNPVMGKAVRSGVEPARGIEFAIDLGVAIMPVVKWRVASDEVIDVVVGIVAACSSEHKSLEIALGSALQRRGELARLDADVKTGVLGHGLDDLSGL